MVFLPDPFEPTVPSQFYIVLSSLGFYRLALLTDFTFESKVNSKLHCFEVTLIRRLNGTLQSRSTESQLIPESMSISNVSVIGNRE